MSYLSMMEAKLPPGFRFHPRDDELICDYLTPKVVSGANGNGGNLYGFLMMIDVDLNNCEPWDLPETACVAAKEWYFFNLRDRKYATGQRTNRATLSGYWKATGKDRQIVRKGTLVGMRKTLVFYQGRAPKGKKTDWVMHEFRLEGRSDHPPSKFFVKEDWVLCRVFYKSRVGMSSKPTVTESSYDDTGSSSLPPLIDTYISFDQTFPPPPPPLPPLNLDGSIFTTTTTTTTPLEQVPCFSNFPPQYIPAMESSLPTKTTLGGFPKDLASCLNPLQCDKKVIKSVLDHLSKLEGNHQQVKRENQIPPSLAQASSESYFSETALSSSMWYPFQS